MVRRRKRVSCWRSGLGYYKESGADSQTAAGDFDYNSGDFRAGFRRLPGGGKGSGILGVFGNGRP